MRRRLLAKPADCSGGPRALGQPRPAQRAGVLLLARAPRVRRWQRRILTPPSPRRRRRMAKQGKAKAAAPKQQPRVEVEQRPDEAFTTERAVRSGRANAASGRIMVGTPLLRPAGAAARRRAASPGRAGAARAARPAPLCALLRAAPIRPLTHPPAARRSPSPTTTLAPSWLSTTPSAAGCAGSSSCLPPAPAALPLLPCRLRPRCPAALPPSLPALRCPPAGRGGGRLVEGQAGLPPVGRALPPRGGHRRTVLGARARPAPGLPCRLAPGGDRARARTPV